MFGKRYVVYLVLMQIIEEEEKNYYNIGCLDVI